MFRYRGFSNCYKPKYSSGMEVLTAMFTQCSHICSAAAVPKQTKAAPCILHTGSNRASHCSYYSLQSTEGTGLIDILWISARSDPH